MTGAMRAVRAAARMKAWRSRRRAGPMAPNHPDFPSIILDPADEYRQHTVWRFSRGLTLDAALAGAAEPLDNRGAFGGFHVTQVRGGMAWDRPDCM